MPVTRTELFLAMFQAKPWQGYGFLLATIGVCHVHVTNHNSNQHQCHTVDFASQTQVKVKE